jgi:23S rRNA (guanosine2251-2'-O)-methyltransferase
MMVYGINPVLEALRAGRVTAIRVNQRGGGRMQELLALASEKGVKVQRVDGAVLDRLARAACIKASSRTLRTASTDYSPEELVRGADGPALIVVLDGIEDPHNLGAILRTADAGRRPRRDRAEPAGCGAGWCGCEGVVRRGGAYQDRAGGEHRACD